MPLSNNQPNNILSKNIFTANSIPDVARSRFVINVIVNMAYTILSTVIMFWYIPFLVRHLGVSVYAMIPLANSLINYTTIITDGIGSAINRFMTMDLNRHDERNTLITFNTALIVSIAVVGVLLPISLIFTWLFPVFFQVPQGFENEARILFGSAVVAFFLTMIGSNFSVSSLIFHRFDLRSMVDGSTIVIRVGLAVLLIILFPASLWQVGVGFVSSAIVFFIGSWFVWRKLTPQLQIKLSAFDGTRLGEIISLSGWSIAIRIGLLLFLSTDLIIINIYFGAEMTGWYGTLLLFPGLIRVLAGTVSSVLSPAIMARYAVSDFEGIKFLAARAVKFMSLALALPIGLLCGFAKPLLNLWLGPNFQSLDLLLIILIAHLCINLAVLPLAYVLTSYNKLKVQGIVTLVLGIVNVGMAVVVARSGIWQMVGIAIVTMISLTLNNFFFLSSYSARIMGLRWWAFYRTPVPGIGALLVVGVSAYSLVQVWWPATWPALGCMTITISIEYCVVVYYLMLTLEDRRFILELIPNTILRYLRRV